MRGPTLVDEPDGPATPLPSEATGILLPEEALAACDAALAAEADRWCRFDTDEGDAAFFRSSTGVFTVAFFPEQAHAILTELGTYGVLDGKLWTYNSRLARQAGTDDAAVLGGGWVVFEPEPVFRPK